MPEFKKEGRGFKMKGFSPFTKKESPYYKKTDPPVDKNWKANQSLTDDLKSLQKDLKEAKTVEQKRKIKMDIVSVRKQLETGLGSYGNEQWDKE